MTHVVKQIQRRNDNKIIIVEGKDGVTTEEKSQVKIITICFRYMFHKESK